MPEPISQEMRKIEAYLDVIKTRIIEPIQKADIGLYCTATLLLLFAAINGLGKLIHGNTEARSNARIRAFLDYMGGNYSNCKKELLDLRHSLVHEAINVASYMSQTEMGSEQHLKKIDAGGFIYVNTSIVYRDFVRAFDRLRDEFKSDEQKMISAAQRLDWREDNTKNQHPDIPASLPPPIEFIWAK